MFLRGIHHSPLSPAQTRASSNNLFFSSPGAPPSILHLCPFLHHECQCLAHVSANSKNDDYTQGMLATLVNFFFYFTRNSPVWRLKGAVASAAQRGEGRGVVQSDCSFWHPAGCWSLITCDSDPRTLTFWIAGRRNRNVRNLERRQHGEPVSPLSASSKSKTSIRNNWMSCTRAACRP